MTGNPGQPEQHSSGVAAAVVVGNPTPPLPDAASAAATDAPVAPVAPAAPVAPVNPAGQPYALEMIYAAEGRRAYADEPADLVDVLAPGYRDGDEAARWKHRLHLAARYQVLIQAEMNTDPAYASLPIDQQQTLSSDRSVPPNPATWDCPIPLVLIATHYQPAGPLARPRDADGLPPNVWWIDPSDEWTLLATLTDLGAVQVNTRTT